MRGWFNSGNADEGTKNGQQPVFLLRETDGVMGGRERKQNEKGADGGGLPSASARVDREIERKAWGLADPLCLAEGLELVSVEYQREPRGRILRLYIDGPNGVSLDDCVSISRGLGDILDVALEDIGPYHLEVSSPGPERPIRRTADFARFQGRTAVIKTDVPIEGKKKIRGILDGVEEDCLRLRTPQGTVRILLADIARARLVDRNGEIGC